MAGTTSRDEGPEIVLAGVGDIIVNAADPTGAFAKVRAIFDAADVVFGNCEAPCSDVGHPNPAAPMYLLRPAASIPALAEVGFDVLGFANNHALDSGFVAADTTIREMDRAGIAHVGYGANKLAATAPAVLERAGVKIGFLGYTYVCPAGYGATVDRAGCAWLRAHNVLEPRFPGQPGTGGRWFTIADPRDLDETQRAIYRLRETVDVVVVSVHWGLHLHPVTVADYESQAGHAFIDAGADLVLGHHQHILKGVETYRDRVIFHGLGNFAFDSQETDFSASFRQRIRTDDEYGVYPRPGSAYWFHDDARHTAIVRCRLSKGGIREVAFVPCEIDDLARPVPLTATEADFDRVVEFVERSTVQAGFTSTFARRASDVVVVSGAGSRAGRGGRGGVALSS